MYNDILKEQPTSEIVKELELRFPTGFILAFLTDDPSMNREGFTEYYKSFGPPSTQRGLSLNLVDYIEQANSPMLDFDDFDEDCDCDDEMDAEL